MPKSMDDYMPNWKHTAVEVYNSMAEDKLYQCEKEIKFLQRHIESISVELDEYDRRLGDALKAMDTLIIELTKHKRMTFLIMKHPELVKQLRSVGFEESVLQTILKE